MLESSLTFITIIAYCLAGALQTLRLLGKVEIGRIWVIVLATFAIIIHALLLHQWIDVAAGQNLAFFNVWSQCAWIVSLILLLGAFYRPLINLGILVFPLSALSVFCAWLVPGNEIVATQSNPKELIHIVLALVAFSVFAIAAAQALMLTIQDRLLRQRKFSNVLLALPPLESVEKLLFSMVVFGILLLSVVLISSIISFPQLLFTQANFKHTIFAIAAWLVFAILLAGRLIFGWRGRTAIYWTLSGMGLLFLSYFGSKLL